VEVRFDDDGLPGLGESGASGESVVSDNVSASCRSLSDRIVCVWEEAVEAVSESESLGGCPELAEVLSVSMVFTGR